MTDVSDLVSSECHCDHIRFGELFTTQGFKDIHAKIRGKYTNVMNQKYHKPLPGQL